MDLQEHADPGRAIDRRKHPVSHMKVAQLLREQGYSLQGNRKTEEGGDHPDRDAQFRHINTQVKRALAKGVPVISVDTKKKELVGNYENGGRQWLPAKQPVKVNGHDFPPARHPPRLPLRGLRRGAQPGIRQRGDEPRHRRVRRRIYSRMVARRRPPAVSQDAGLAHHGRRRRQQRLAAAAVETGIAEAGR